MASGVEFEEDVNTYAHRPPGSPAPQQGVPQFGSSSRYVPPSAKEPPMVQWLMKHHIVKSPVAAQGLLVALVVVNLIITYIIIKYFLL